MASDKVFSRSEFCADSESAAAALAGLKLGAVGGALDGVDQVGTLKNFRKFSKNRNFFFRDSESPSNSEQKAPFPEL